MLQPSQAWLQDPEVFAVNREAPHSDHRITTPQGSLRQSLHGIWQLRYRENGIWESDTTWQKWILQSNVAWDTVVVPGHLPLQGYGKPQYVNTQYPWEGHETIAPPEIPPANPLACYAKTFDLAPALQGKDVFLELQGVEPCCYIWLNGQFIGYAEDSFTPSTFRLTQALQPTGNRLIIAVYRWCTGSWLEDQDFWRFFGIFRNVELYAKPESHVEDLHVIADYAPESGEGLLSVSTILTGLSPAQVTVTLQAPNGDTLFVHTGSALTCRIPSIQPWSGEQPNLYTLLVQLWDENKVCIETAETEIGFRRFCIQNGLMLLNGKRIVFRGVNRHEFHAERGRCITEADMLYDIRLLKQHNINAVRTSHYPNQSAWYALCDRFGIYLIDEVNLETHGACDRVPASEPEWQSAVLDRAKSMWYRDRNHASILLWSCGNESHCGDVIANMAAWLHETDKTRLVHYEGVGWNRAYDYITDVESRMYAKPADVIAYLESNPTKPYINCEYIHAMGNSVGGMCLYTALEDRYPQYQGGFIWDYLDQALYRTAVDGERVLAYGGDFGDRPTDYGFCTNGIVYADRMPSPKLQEVKALYAPIRMQLTDGCLCIENRNLFADTGNLLFRVRLKYEDICLAEEIHRITVSAGETQRIPLSQTIPETGAEYVQTATAELTIDTAWAKAGHEIAFAQAVYHTSQAESERQLQVVRTAYGSFAIGVHGRNWSMLFDRREGGLTSFCYDGIEYIERVPKVSFWRAPTDNDRGAGYPQAAVQWRIAAAYATPIGEEISVEEQAGRLRIVIPFQAASTPRFRYTVTYVAYFDSSLEVTAGYPGVSGMADMPVFALDFAIPTRYRQVRYYGMGPKECYCDRACGARLDVHRYTAESNVSGYLNPQECGNRTGVRYVQVTDENGVGLEFRAEGKPFEMSVLPYSAYELEQAQHREELCKPYATWVRIAGKQMGVGGDDSWGAPVHTEYRIPASEPQAFSMTIRPYKESKGVSQ